MGADIMATMDQSAAEYQSWQRFVTAWNTSSGIDHDINDSRYNSVVMAVREWGEALAELRIAQQA